MASERLTYSAEEAAGVLGVSKWKVYEAVRTGQLRAIQIGRRLVLPVTAIEDLLGMSLRGNGHRGAGQEHVNLVEVTGRLAGDPVKHQTRAGAPMAVLREAVRRRSGEDAVLFIDVVAFGAQAEVATSLRKGRRVLVDGRLDLREWTSEDGSHRQSHQIVAERIELLGETI